MLRIVTSLFVASALAAQDLGKDAWEVVAPQLSKHCYPCHGEGKELEGDLDLKARPFLGDRARTVAVLREMRGLVTKGEMPPEDADSIPTREERAAIVAWVDDRLREIVAKGGLDPGRVTMRKISRAEYANAIRDLFGVRGEVTKGFPADDLGYGFDNIGAASTFSVLHFEKYLVAAERIAARALGLGDQKTTQRKEAETLDVSRANVSVHAEWLCLCSPGPALHTFTTAQPGRYSVQVRAAAQLAGPQAPKLVITLDGQTKLTKAIEATARTGTVVEVEIECSEGRHELGFDFPNDWWKPEEKDPSQRDRNLLIDWIQLTGPLDTAKPPPESAWLLGLDPGTGDLVERARPIVTELLRRAWRRPASPAEVARVVGLVAKGTKPGDSFAQSLGVAIEAALVSPHFLFRPEPGGIHGESSAEPMDSWALATRLSFFLWSSIPDPALLDRAARDELVVPATLKAETKRMLADPRAEAIARNFAAQWLEVRQLEQAAPDRKRYPSFTKELRKDMREETERLFLAVLREDRDVRDLLDPPFTFLNERLARHYGVAGVTGSEMRKVDLTDRRFGGLLAQASILTVTSNPTRTSPTKRGKWILENILDQAPPPPPPGNDSLKGEKLVKDSKSLREQMELHRKDPQCATCHVRMDALGFALETFDPIGRWRDKDGDEPIDASGKLPDGRTLHGIADLKRVLRADPAFVRCLLEKLFVYAIGRGTTTDDELLLDSLAEKLPRDKPTLADLITGIVDTEAFRSRRIARVK